MLVLRVRRSHLRAAVFGAVLVGAGFGVGSAFAGHDADVIHACVSNQTGSLRVVNSASGCRDNERPLEWSAEAAIPTPQVCGAGQFVTGLDNNGQLICAAPEPAAACGNGIAEEGEVCDTAGPSANCDADCTAPACGDGTVNNATGEQCDDGNQINGDGCSTTCNVD